MTDKIIFELLNPLLNSLKKFYKAGGFVLFFGFLGAALVIYAYLSQFSPTPLFIISALLILGCMLYFSVKHFTVIRKSLSRIEEMKKHAFTLPVPPKQKNPDVTHEQIQEAIGKLREFFPDDARLAKVSDTEIEQKVAKFLKSDEIIAPQLSVPSAERIATAEALQDTCAFAIAVFVVDCIFIILGVVGFRATYNKFIRKVAAQEISEQVTKNLPKWKELVYDFKHADSRMDQARVIFKIGSYAYTMGCFRGILQQIKSSMEWWEWTITGVAALSTLIFMFTTGGVAIVANAVMCGADIAYAVRDGVIAVQVCND